jgi:hypothetical protein
MKAAALIMAALLVIAGTARALPGTPPPKVSKTAADGPGPRPDTSVLHYAIESVLKEHANDPDSIQDLAVSQPVTECKGSAARWRVPFTYRARNGFGGLMKYQGAVWMKNGKVIRERWQ